MEPINIRSKHGPEYHIQNKWVKFLTAKGWHVERLIGNAFQSGIPDLLLMHPEHGIRFVDIKVDGKYSFTAAQKQKWPLWLKFGCGIWILSAKSSEDCTKSHMVEQYERLFKGPNVMDFWKDSWHINLDKLLEELDEPD
jgi:hypothetical protein